MKRIYVDMCADLFHAGHVAYLKQVRELYEDSYVLVGIHTYTHIHTHSHILPPPPHTHTYTQVRELYEDSYVLVGIHSDATIESYKRTPVCTMAERVIMVQACRYCDEVIPEAPLQVRHSYI